MINQIQSFIQKNNLFHASQNILLTVSGGVDSVVMLHSIKALGYQAGVAHCNFRLRGEESERDCDFVAGLSHRLHLPFHKEIFDTKKYAAENALSVQMAARQLRYQWFEELRQKFNYDCIAVAHNRDDVVETFHINLLRGTGLKGITGIKAKNGYIVRPLLFASRGQIMDFARKNNIAFCEDSSNASTKYLRNKIRHDIIPQFEMLNPKYKATIAGNIEHFAGAYRIFSEAIRQKKQECSRKQGEKHVFFIEKLKKLSPLKTYLFEFLREYGFSEQNTDDIIIAFDAEPGRQFFSNDYRLICDRDTLIVSPKTTVTSVSLSIEKEDIMRSEKISLPDSGYALQFEIIERTDNFIIPTSPGIACFDYQTLKFPLLIRKWKAGDYFYPLGMKKHKKLSDFFIDEKINRLEKEQQWLLCSQQNIAWIIGRRLDNRFKITPQSRIILKCAICAGKK